MYVLILVYTLSCLDQYIQVEVPRVYSILYFLTAELASLHVCNGDGLMFVFSTYKIVIIKPFWIFCIQLLHYYCNTHVKWENVKKLFVNYIKSKMEMLKFKSPPYIRMYILASKLKSDLEISFKKQVDNIIL